MKKAYAFFPLIAAIITFIIGYAALRNDDLSTAILLLFLSIILFVSAGALKVSLQIDELRKEIKKNRNPDSKQMSRFVERNDHGR